MHRLVCLLASILLLAACGGDDGAPGPGASTGPGGSNGSGDGSADAQDGGPGDGDGDVGDGDGDVGDGDGDLAGDGDASGDGDAAGDGDAMGDGDAAGDGDGDTMQTPTCDALVDPACAVRLDSLAPSVGTLTPAFERHTLAYTLDLGMAPTELSLTASAAAGLGITVDGDALASGATHGPVAAPAVGEEATMVVRVSDGAIDTDYTLTVRRGWRQSLYAKASNTGANDRFGFSVATDGQTLVVGANEEGSAATGIDGGGDNDDAPRSGAAYVYTLESGSWIFSAYLKAGNAEALDGFGHSVAVDGDVIVVGAPQESGGGTGTTGDPGDNTSLNAGAAYVFRRSGESWQQEAYLKPDHDQADGNWFGASVGVSGDVIVVGAHLEDGSTTGVGTSFVSEGEDNSGSAHVFRWSGSAWAQEAYLKAGNAESGDEFGKAVAIDGDLIVVGAAEEDGSAMGVDGASNENASNAGAAYVYRWGGSAWQLDAYLKSDTTAIDDNFGCSVAVRGALVAVGACAEDEHAGAVYVFRDVTGTWTPEARLVAGNAAAGDRYGSGVGITGNTIVVGAHGEGGGAGGINPETMPRTAQDSGAAYVYEHSGDGWVYQAYLKGAGAALLGMRFGWAVAAGGGRLAVSGRDESGGGTGVDPPTDTVAGGSGAVFVFE